MKPEQMEFWIDLNLPPSLAHWIKKEFGIEAKSFHELGFTFKTDFEVFNLARQNTNIIIITTKDIDFVKFAADVLLPPKILYINTGNISNKQLKEIFTKSFYEVIKLFRKKNQYLIELTT